MPVRVRIPKAIADPIATSAADLEIDPAPADLGALLRALDAIHPGLGAALDSSAVNAAVNGEVVLHGRDRTPLTDGDEVEFLVMFAGG